ELMRERVDTIDTIRKARAGRARDSLGGASDAADRAQNPDLIARAGSTVCAPITHELAFRGGDGCLRRIGGELIAIETRQQGLHVVRVYMATASNRRRRSSDGKAILQHWRTCGNIAHRELMASADCIAQRNRGIADLNSLARAEVAQRYSDIVLR